MSTNSQWAIASYMLADRDCNITSDSPAYLEKLLLATGILSFCSGLFNISAVCPLSLTSNGRALSSAAKRLGKCARSEDMGRPCQIQRRDTRQRRVPMQIMGVCSQLSNLRLAQIMDSLSLLDLRFHIQSGTKDTFIWRLGV